MTLGAGAVTLVEGASFCVCAPSGDIAPGGAHGVFFADTRVLSRWELRIDEEAVEPLTVVPKEPFRALFVGRARPRPGRADSTLLVQRDRYVGVGLREDVTLENLSGEPVGCRVELAVDSDFADLFEVKADHVRRRARVEQEAVAGELRITGRFPDGHTRGVRLTSDQEMIAGAGRLAFRVVVPPRETWRVTLQLHPSVDGHEPPPRYPTHRPVEQAVPVRRLRDWERESPEVECDDPALERALRRSRLDLGALRLFDPDAPEGPSAVAAGAPWFMTLFGRDSLITSYMSLPLDHGLAVGTLRALARRQGTKSDPLTEEEPGKIMHELRSGTDTAGMLGGSQAYYGTVDATPLFVMLLGELYRWGLHRDEVDRLLPHADRALEWIEEYGDADGDLFVEYRRKTDRGLVNQGWKDSFDGINFADGRIAEPPIALAEVQGYVYAAYVARAHIARERGDAEVFGHYRDKALRLRKAFNETFWLEDRGYFAVGLDRDKRPIDALASNMGHCLWTGIVDPAKARSVADRLMSPQMFSGWGVRTLACDMGAYNPMSYHNGSVWPHDCALIATGLMRYGFVAEAHRLVRGLLDAATAFGGRLPELFCGFDRSRYEAPVPYPTSCSPQAWAAAAPVQLLRVLLRLDPAIPQGRVWCAPALPESITELTVRGLPLAGGRVTVTRDGVTGLPDGVELIARPRDPLAALEGRPETATRG
ncbi:amylo-alpha-1,6-glucosidase [Thermomonospora catenispora]|nr:amylo-alpha-1,6-glucosidase [Thermomonospora catenispora]